MYENNRDQRFDGNGSPDDHRAQETAPNFIMKDPGEAKREPESVTRPDSSQASSQYSGQAQPGAHYAGSSQTDFGYGTQQPYTSMDQNGPAGIRGGGPGPMNGGQQFGGGPSYGHQGQEMPNYQNGPTADSGQKKAGKRRGMAKKVAGITAAALLFGVVSGGTMVGI